MGIYSKHILPKIIHIACGSSPAMRQRQKIVPFANGRVLEVGIGSGLNLPLYDPSKVTKIWGLDPSPELLKMAERTDRASGVDVEFLNLPAEEIPLENGSIDTVVITYTLCTISDVVEALGQVRRVLKTYGELLFCEHGLAPDERVRRWQRRMNPLWKRVGGGCHLDREIPLLIEKAGFRIRKMDTMYLPGWRPATFNYWGNAIPA